jgi:putative hydrolase of HD superfamily
VRSCLCRLLPLQKAGEFYELYCCHVDSRRGVKPNSAEARAYRKLLELEEAILLWEEIQKEGGPSATTKLLSKMKEVGFPGQERLQVFNDVSELQNLLRFFLKISDLIRLKRTGWVQSGIRDPERVAGHMFRMAVMAMLFEEDVHDTKILNGSAVVLSLVHDMAECIVGDITPNDPVSAEDKHTMEMDAMSELVKNLPTGRMALEFFNGLERYEEQHPDDWDAKLTKDLDKFDMILQAYEYEEKCKKGQFLQHFFDSTKTVFKTSQIKAWDSRLRQQRDSTV